MKYRILTDDELSSLENELKQFLIVNGIEGDKWAELNKNESEKALQLVELFSDNVLQAVYEKIEFLEKQTEDALFVFHCAKNEIELLVVQKKVDSDTSFQLSSNESIHKALLHHADQLVIFHQAKVYSKEREMEIHQLFIDGCIISTREFWELMNKVQS